MGAGLHRPLCPPWYGRDQLWARQQAHGIQGTWRAEGTAGMGGCQPTAASAMGWTELTLHGTDDNHVPRHPKQPAPPWDLGHSHASPTEPCPPSWERPHATSPTAGPESWGRKELLSLPAELGTMSDNSSFLPPLSLGQPASTLPARTGHRGDGAPARQEGRLCPHSDQGRRCHALSCWGQPPPSAAG